jgi:hypothetical protein
MLRVHATVGHVPLGSQTGTVFNTLPRWDIERRGPTLGRMFPTVATVQSKAPYWAHVAGACHDGTYNPRLPRWDSIPYFFHTGTL